MPLYCKAYQVKDLKAFDGWSGSDVQGLSEEDICYIWADFTITKGCLGEREQSLLDVTDAWKSFCTDTLSFEVPEDLRDDGATEKPDNGDGASS